MPRWVVALVVGAGILVACPVALAAAPGVSTGPPAGVSYYNLCTPQASASLTMTGSVDPQGLATSWYFQYGTGGQLDQQTPVLSAGTGGTVSAALAGVSPELAYRLVATNADGVSYGATEMLAMPLYCQAKPPHGLTGPPAVTTYPPTGMTYVNPCKAGTTVSLTMNAEVNGEGGPTEWFFQYGTSQAYSAQTQPQALGSAKTAVRSVSAAVTGQPLPFHYRVVAVNADGTSYGADEVNDPAFPCPYQPPAAGSSAGGGSGTSAQGASGSQGGSGSFSTEASTRPSGCVVPREVGARLRSALRALAAGGCSAGRVRHRYSRRVRRGRVIALSRRAGAHLAAGARIGVVVSRGRAR